MERTLEAAGRQHFAGLRAWHVALGRRCVLSLLLDRYLDAWRNSLHAYFERDGHEARTSG